MQMYNDLLPMGASSGLAAGALTAGSAITISSGLNALATTVNLPVVGQLPSKLMNKKLLLLRK